MQFLFVPEAGNISEQRANVTAKLSADRGTNNP
jgi:hypothetical protein